MDYIFTKWFKRFNESLMTPFEMKEFQAEVKAQGLTVLEVVEYFKFRG